jgi:hypothetical protein
VKRPRPNKPGLKPGYVVLGDSLRMGGTPSSLSLLKEVVDVLVARAGVGYTLQMSDNGADVTVDVERLTMVVFGVRVGIGGHRWPSLRRHCQLGCLPCD